MTAKTIKVRLIMKEENKVLLLEQTNENGGKYTLAGGTVEDVEFASKALIRECKEEIGIKIKATDLTVVHILHKKKLEEDRLTIYFQAAKWEKRIKCLEKKKFATVDWFEIDNLPIRTSFTVRHVLEQIEMGSMYSELLVGKKSAFKKLRKDRKKLKKTEKRTAKAGFLITDEIIISDASESSVSMEDVTVVV